LSDDDEGQQKKKKAKDDWRAPATVIRCTPLWHVPRPYGHAEMCHAKPRFANDDNDTELGADDRH
jgi:hypothetical protein